MRKRGFFVSGLSEAYSGSSTSHIRQFEIDSQTSTANHLRVFNTAPFYRTRIRYLTVLVHPAEGRVFHPLGKKLADEPTIAREAIHHVELLADGTVLSFAEGSGDRERYEGIMRDSPYVVDFLVSGGIHGWR